MLYKGQCHCGAVEFEVEAPAEVTCYDCNCSVCTMSGYLHLVVPGSAFTLLAGRDSLATYTFNTRVARHYFCTTCGIKSFYVPRSNPDGYSVNVRCLRPIPERIDIQKFDGQNWEDHAHEVSQLSKEP